MCLYVWWILLYRWKERCMRNSIFSYIFHLPASKWPSDHPNGGHVFTPERATNQTPKKRSLGRTWWNHFKVVFEFGWDETDQNLVGICFRMFLNFCQHFCRLRISWFIHPLVRTPRHRGVVVTPFVTLGCLAHHRGWGSLSAQLAMGFWDAPRFTSDFWEVICTYIIIH